MRRNFLPNKQAWGKSVPLKHTDIDIKRKTFLMIAGDRQDMGRWRGVGVINGGGMRLELGW